MDGEETILFRSNRRDREPNPGLCRCQVIQLNGESSDEMRLQFGVPQGSVLGPLLFTSYTAPLSEIARRHGVELNLYVDDTQV